MTDPEGTAAKRRVDIAFLQCCDATVFVEPVLRQIEVVVRGAHGSGAYNAAHATAGVTISAPPQNLRPR